MERIAVHNCKTGRVELRERTPEEQAVIDAERAVTASRPAVKSDLELLKERVAALESVARL